MNEDKKLSEYIRLTELIKKTIGEPKSENQELLEFLSQNDYAEELIHFLSSETRMKNADKELRMAYEERGEDELLKKIENLSVRKRRLSRLRVMVAGVSIAAALLFLSFVVYNNLQTSTPSLAVVEEVIHYEKPILIRGEKRVVEIHAQGDKIVLDDFIEKDVVLDSITQCRLVIPHGQIYTVELSDGTNVTLNANSELIYTSSFTSDERLVEVKGEAFFDVRKSSVPFVVKANDSRIKVYGTTFNVNTRDTTKTKTLLLSGSIGFSTPTIKEILLEPNQMIVADVTTNEYSVVSVTNNRYTAWLTNYFVLYEAPLTELLGIMEDWYNVDFEYSDDQFEGVKVSFSIKRPSTVHDMFKFIENIMDVQFKEMKGGIYRIERGRK